MKNFLSQEFNLQVIPYSLYLAPRGGGLFISGPFGGGLIGEGGLIERGTYLFIKKTSDGDYLSELQ